MSLVCAVLLTGGAGFGYLSNCNYEGPNNPANGTFFVLAVIGVIFCAATAIWLLAAIIVRLFRKRPDQENK
jgi:predicted RND superfamily exporter protein